MTEISPLAFYLFAGSALAFSVLTILRKNPVSSAFSLVLVFFSFAGIYALLGAHLVATLQVLVYAGAIMVLFVFVIMLLSTDVPSLDIARTPTWFKALAGMVVLGLFALMTRVFRTSPVEVRSGVYTPEAVASAGGNTQVLSELMFSEYVLPFELTSVLLLAGIVGAVAIAKRHNKKGSGHASASR
jgi:NADH-quinone oxidoreductase subunit J